MIAKGMLCWNSSGRSRRSRSLVIRYSALQVTGIEEGVPGGENEDGLAAGGVEVYFVSYATGCKKLSKT